MGRRLGQLRARWLRAGLVCELAESISYGLVSVSSGVLVDHRSARAGVAEPRHEFLDGCASDRFLPHSPVRECRSVPQARRTQVRRLDQDGRPGTSRDARTTRPLSGEAGNDSLAILIGSTRAAVLRALAEPCGTADLAATTGISAASASEHAKALRDADLVQTRREGRSVRHSLTPLGRTMLGRLQSAAT